MTGVDALSGREDGGEGKKIKGAGMEEEWTEVLGAARYLRFRAMRQKRS